MRLTKIKLSGFKSFVEKTVINLSNQRTGVVGPNGCGKSNIVDAVRWVLGESRATELRGESHQDVIFSGSSSRHKAGRASVELIFDNSESKISGPWFEFSEISVKKIVTSDGQSNNYINDHNVRKKDIIDLFLGTGLGPKSYAIVGQGTIGKIADAKPDELRIFLEEASGVSKYRLRRKETETRLRDGKESMNRVADIILELNDRVLELENQAEVASKYKIKIDRKKEFQSLLLCKKKEFFEDSINNCENKLKNFSFEYEKKAAVVKTLELEQASNREKANLLQDNLDECTQKYFNVNSKITAKENENKLINEKIQFAKETSNNALILINNLESLIRIEKANIVKQNIKLNDIESSISDKLVLENDLTDKISPLKSHSSDLQISYTEARAERAVLESEKLNYDLQVKEHGESEQKFIVRINEINNELNSIDEVLTIDIKNLKSIRDSKSHSALDAKKYVAHKQSQKDTLEKQFQTTNSNYLLHEKKVLSLTAEHVGLVAVQKKMLDLDSLEEWLKKNKISQLPSLVSQLIVNNQWRVAVENILKNHLSSLLVDSISDLLKLKTLSPPASISFYSVIDKRISENLNEKIIGFENLSFAIESNNNASNIARNILKNYYCVDSFEDGIKNISKLYNSCRFVTKEGHLIGNNNLFLYAESSSTSLLNRAEKIKTIEIELSQLESKKSDLNLLNQSAKKDLNNAILELEKARDDASSCIQEEHDAELKLVVLKEKYDSIDQKRDSLTRNKYSFNLELTKIQNETLTLKKKQDQNLIDINNSQQLLDKLAHDISVSTEELSLLSIQQKKYSEDLHLLKLEERSIVELINSMRRKVEELKVEKDKTILDKNNSLEKVENLKNELVLNSMDDLLDEQKFTETELKLARNSIEQKNHEIRQNEEERLLFQKEVMPLDEKIKKYELEKSRLKGVIQELDDQLNSSNFDFSDFKRQVISKNPTYINLTTSRIEKEIDVLTIELEAFGSVNLAAIDELDEVKKRKNTFETQLADLEKAEAELLQAIIRMDSETKELLRNTFDSVNKNLNILFVELFGGGNSKLIFLEDDILTSGMSLMAQPPGKKITRIQQLSGGEKSLAAIALVISFFKLNPAPFCILDEADAALDDANTYGLNKMLTDMSEITQLIFVTHNKTLMEIADQLIGITMQEPGVSRAVSVDINMVEAFVKEAA